MATKLTTLFFAITFLLNIQAQSIAFYKSYGGNGYDYGQGVTQLPDSSYAVTGSSSSFFDGPSQAFLLRVDSLGNFLWSANYGGDQSDWGRRVFYSPTQGYWIAGYSNSFGAGDFDFYLIKTDAAGNKQWEKTYGTSDWEQLWDAVLLPDSGLVMVGQTSGALSLDEDIYIVRTNFIGDTLWTKRVQSAGKDIAYTCMLLNDTTVIVGGCSSHAADSMTAYIASIHTNGVVNWEKFNGANGNCEIYDLDTLNNDFYAVGSIIIKDSTEQDSWMLHVDSLGNFISQAIDNKSGKDYSTHVRTSNDATLHTSIWTETTSFPIYPGGPDLLYCIYTTVFSWVNGVSLSGVNPDECHQLIRTIDGGFALVGIASDPGYSTGGSDVTLIKIGANGEIASTKSTKNELVSVKELHMDDDQISIYPNPVSEILQVKTTEEGIIQYTLIDAGGKTILSGELKHEINVSFLEKGIYFLHLVSKNSSVTKQILKL